MRWIVKLTIAFCVAVPNSGIAADPPSIDLALSFQPKQPGIQIDSPTVAERSQCKVQVEQLGKVSGWVVFGPQGQVIRRFVDTDGDNQVDQWRYYHNGLEVYRDYDTMKKNNKVDQSRWLNTGGSRWAIDADENGVIDGWKRISAEEATKVAVEALIKKDGELLSSVLATGEELKELGIIDSLSKEMLEAVAGATTFANTAASKSKTISPQTRWVRFDSSMLMPNVIPVEEGKAKQDLTVYENVMAIIETDGSTGFVQIGEMLKVGDVWKLTQLPRPIEGNSIEISAGGLLMQPAALRGGVPGGFPGSVDPKMQELLDQLQKLDRASPSPNSAPNVVAKYNRDRVEVLGKLVAASATPQERTQWLQQMVDGIAAAIQSGSYPEGLKQLQSIESDLKTKTPTATLVPYVTYRRLLSEYGTKIRNPNSSDQERQESQVWWLSELEKFANAYPKAPDANDAMLQLAIAKEFSGAVDDSKEWYGRIAKSADVKDEAVIRAKGALRRLSLTGKPLAITGKTLRGQAVDIRAYRGKTVLVIFWATWCQPCTEDLPQLQKLYAQYQRTGFEVLGINLDTNPALIQPYLQQNRVAWPHIQAVGGLEGDLAKSFGIISLPTMFLVDRNGVVVNNATSVEDLKERLPKLLK